MGLRQFCRAVSRRTFFRLKGKAAGDHKIRQLLFKAAFCGKCQKHKEDERKVQEIKKAPGQAERK